MKHQRWPPFDNHYVITTSVTSSLPVADVKGNIVITFNLAKSPMKTPKNWKKSGLNRVKIGGPCESARWLQNNTSTLPANLHPECQFLELELPKN